MRQMQENPNLIEGRAEATPKPLAEFLWKAVIIGTASIFLCWLLKALENWRCCPRIPEENLQNSRENSPANGMKQLVERPLQKKDACKLCRLSSVVLEEQLSIKGGRSMFTGPKYYLSCLIGNSNQLIKSLIDTGCTASAIDLRLVKILGLLDHVDRTKRIRYEVMGGERLFTYGMLCVPVRTVSGFILIEELMVLEKDTLELIIGLDVLAVNNCSLILDVDQPKIMMRERDACSSFKGVNIRESADVLAKLNGVLYKSTLDTGSFRTVVPKSLDFAQESLTEPAYLNVAAKDQVRVSKRVKSLKLEINDCVGCVDPLVMAESRPMIGTDFLQNRRIDFIHGKVYLESLNIESRR